MRAAIKVETILGTIWITETDGLISEVSLAKPDALLSETALLQVAKQQLCEYFAKKRISFDLPLLMNGTPFYNSVWKALCEIPYGKTQTYGEIASKIGKPKAARAVGMANHNNPIMIIVPCHRVIGASGALVGYACGLNIKKTLLSLEGVNGL